MYKKRAFAGNYLAITQPLLPFPDGFSINAGKLCLEKKVEGVLLWTYDQERRTNQPIIPPFLHSEEHLNA